MAHDCTTTQPVTLAHALLVPLLLCAGALYLHGSGLDERISALAFDTARGSFPAHNVAWLESIGHRLAKSAMFALGLLILAAALLAPAIVRLRPCRALLWTTFAAMASGPLLVVWLKNLNSIPCPWSLARFGGFVSAGGQWFVPQAEVARCFPSGHAAGGFAPFALYFAGHAAGRSSWRWSGLAAALLCGALFSGVRIVQGAHFPSHNLWSAAIDWIAAAACFAVLTHVQRAKLKRIAANAWGRA